MKDLNEYTLKLVENCLGKLKSLNFIAKAGLEDIPARRGFHRIFLLRQRRMGKISVLDIR